MTRLVHPSGQRRAQELMAHQDGVAGEVGEDAKGRRGDGEDGGQEEGVSGWPAKF